MRIARAEAEGRAPFWGVVTGDGSTIRLIEGAFADWAPALTRGAGAAALRFTGETLALDSVHLLAPIERGARVMIAGVNYTKHLVEFGVAPPSQPFAFLKAYRALTGPYDPIRFPSLTSELDHEVELVAVIGAEQVDRDDPLSSVLGYTVGNDVSSRDLQRSGPKGVGMDLLAAKSQDATTPVGPWIVTRDEFAPGSPSLQMTLTVDGQVRQSASSGDMTWGVDELIRFIDARTSFDCGDILFTGSPEGVGQGTGVFLNPGEVMETRIEGIGTLRNIIGERG
ncbi:fumarylacetoacetate hydrolase family protein [Sphingobium naphthae]|mgnify:FL=1|uniref:Fumarylacetoacetate hydrolase family protein n=1 Tax=Sphingobium naphthae TaxID=1886786 RepID=A0ABU4A106_9SPHN|nr:fumarylacetoacetate hydrolase family protein [Sphingobium naphthae]MCC4250831.1 fumarylacetoacetate hydrolase family protein [Sphingobium naphthae]MDV5825472.1 fumarylacetoacetate hydrolase family protein [Sphingobium naphthae]|tara:strand:+ start:2328 stop:3173 length:846 start_codon:yes stop_codon:yes gene_type:complete